VEAEVVVLEAEVEAQIEEEEVLDNGIRSW